MTAAARERRPPLRRALPLREAELSRLWAAQMIPPEALVTTDGRAVQVRYRGRRGNGPGPDFRDAVVWTEPHPLPPLPEGRGGFCSSGGLDGGDEAGTVSATELAEGGEEFCSSCGLDGGEEAATASATERAEGRGGFCASGGFERGGEAVAASATGQVDGRVACCAAGRAGCEDGAGKASATDRMDERARAVGATAAALAADALRHPTPDTRHLAAGWLRGDVELHVRSSDFVRHGHHLDRAYLRVALHVVFEHDAGPTTLLDGRVVPVVALGGWVQRRAGEIRLALAGPDAYHEPCHSTVERLGAGAVAAVLEEGGVRRLREKAARLRPLCDDLGPNEALYVALARALGLTRDVAPMEAVARAVPLAELCALAASSGEPEATVEAALLGAAGLLGGQLALWPADDAGSGAGPDARLRAVWHALGAPLVSDAVWAAGPRRPGCGPRERLRALAALALRAGPPLDATLDGWRALLASGRDALLAALTVERLAGRDRALELAVNAALPWLLAAWPNDAALEDAVLTVYRALPAPATYGATRALTDALRDGAGRSLVHGAAATQGALAFTRDWCTQGGCGRCPLS